MYATCTTRIQLNLCIWWEGSVHSIEMRWSIVHNFMFIYHYVYMHGLRCWRCQIIKNSTIFVCDRPSLFFNLVFAHSVYFCVTVPLPTSTCIQGMPVWVFFTLCVGSQTKLYNEENFHFRRVFNHFCMAQYWRHSR